eukprot:CAMPEP_0170150182 /NCGR_PEP_ID=MMETSP0033_2-20121228/45513_1 /TAXON_ID=195969 /ORGANISM="Dolichomastix tenuilepis, Strain CCMP3274" /LENGTH=36 /DNA_ID= /DNA_START= /DNA_END= /DNA_ORIENTATION=
MSPSLPPPDPYLTEPNDTGAASFFFADAFFAEKMKS